MANGSHKEGPARADRIREETEKHKRYLQRMIDEERARGELPSYSDDEPSEVTVNRQGVVAKLGLPRFARNAIGVALALLLVGLGVALVRVAWNWR